MSWVHLIPRMASHPASWPVSWPIRCRPALGVVSRPLPERPPHGACRNGYSAAYRRLTRLLTELSIARADGRYPKLRASLAKTHVLIIGDFGLARLTTENRRDLLENHRRPTCATLDHRHQPVPGRKVARRGRGPDLGRCDPRPTRAPCLPAQLERRIDAKTTKRVDPNRSPKLIIEPPRRFAPKRDRVDRNQ